MTILLGYLLAKNEETHISLPITGSVLAARMRIVVTSGLMDVSRLLKQATVRRNVVVQIIRMLHDARNQFQQR